MDDKSQQKNSKGQDKSKVRKKLTIRVKTDKNIWKLDQVCSSKKLGSDADWVESVVYFR